MVRVKAEMRCPYCDKVAAVSGMTSHVRAKHTENYEVFKNNRLALVEKYKIVEGSPAPAVEEPASPESDAIPPTTREPEPPSTPDPKDQQSGSFLGSVGKALRDW